MENTFSLAAVAVSAAASVTVFFSSAGAVAEL
jgi:hypothetical protein